MNRFVAGFLLLILTAILGYGIVELLMLRVEEGDVFPEYSSLRSDPLGTMALFESLQGLPGLTVERDLSPIERLPTSTNTVYFHIATSIPEWNQMTEETFDRIKTFLNSGNTLVITFYPAPVVPEDPFATLKKPAESEDAKKKLAPREFWGMNVEVRNLVRVDDAYLPQPVQNISGLALPPLMDWNSGIIFTDLGPSWKPIYVRGDAPVLMERPFGPGKAILATDSYFLSNEAMLKDRKADLLAWLIGPNRTVIFDEAHLGITETPGVATLMRRYHLQWFLAGLSLVAVLFVWKNSTSLVPRHAQAPTDNYIEGRDQAAGFVNLLRRSIPSNELLAVCFGEWRKSLGPEKSSSTRVERAEAAFRTEDALTGKERDLVRAYKTISKIVQKQI